MKSFSPDDEYEKVIIPPKSSQVVIIRFLYVRTGHVGVISSKCVLCMNSCVCFTCCLWIDGLIVFWCDISFLCVKLVVVSLPGILYYILVKVLAFTWMVVSFLCEHVHLKTMVYRQAMLFWSFVSGPHLPAVWYFMLLWPNKIWTVSDIPTGNYRMGWRVFQCQSRLFHMEIRKV